MKFGSDVDECLHADDVTVKKTVEKLADIEKYLFSCRIPTLTLILVPLQTCIEFLFFLNFGMLSLRVREKGKKKSSE